MNGELTKKYGEGLMQLLDAEVDDKELEKWLRTQEVAQEVGALLGIVDLLDDILALLNDRKQEEQ